MSVKAYCFSQFKDIDFLQSQCQIYGIELHVHNINSQSTTEEEILQTNVKFLSSNVLDENDHLIRRIINDFSNEKYNSIFDLKSTFTYSVKSEVEKRNPTTGEIEKDKNGKSKKEIVIKTMSSQPKDRLIFQFIQ